MRYTFDEIVGQRVIIESLKRAIKEDKVANAYLFSGPSGCGRRLTASVFAMALNCKGEGQKPCGVCNSCIKFKNGNHPDMHILEPQGQSVKIEQIRKVISEVSRKSYEGGYRAVIIESADKMTKEAQNAFLKTLEESPEKCVFILIVENSYSLLPTIVSRCQVYNFKKAAISEVENYLKKHFKDPVNSISIAAAYSEGLIGKAVKILQDPQYMLKREKLAGLLGWAVNGEPVKLLSKTGEEIQSKQEAEEFIDFCLSWFRDVMFYKETGEDNLLINIDRTETIASLSEALTYEKINSIMDIIRHARRYIGHNVNIKNVIDGMLLDILEVCNG